MTSKIVIKQHSVHLEEKMFKVVKLTNYKNVDVLGQLYTTDQLKKFLNSIPQRITYEILGAE